MVRVLSCPAGCGGRRFEVLNAPLYVDASGTYIEHDSSRATHVCARCASVAVDLAEAMREAERRQDPDSEAIVCPACGTAMLPPEDDPDAEVVECPLCDTRFSLDEGRARLHGGGSMPADAWDSALDDLRQ